MADQEDGAGVISQQFFQQVQGFDVKVVGGFVEHQHIRGLGKQASQQQAVALPPLSVRTGELARAGENRKSCR